MHTLRKQTWERPQKLHNAANSVIRYFEDPEIFQIVFDELHFLCVQTSRSAACSRVCHSAARSQTLSQAVLTATRRMRIASASSADAQWSARWDPAHMHGSILRNIIVKNIHSQVLYIYLGLFNRYVIFVDNYTRKLLL